jgi:hypothetical protein
MPRANEPPPLAPPPPIAEVTGIPTTGPLATLGAMAYLAVLAYPEAPDKRDTFIDACKAWTVRRAEHMTGQKLMKSERLARFRPRALNESGPISSGLHRVGLRLDAAHMASEMMTFSALGDGLSLIKAAKRLHGARVRYRRRKAFDAERAEKTIRSREWKDARPVLHLAFALRAVHLEREEDAAFRMFDLVTNPEWLLGALRAAELLRCVYFPLTGIAQGPAIVLLPQEPSEP